MEIDLLRWGTVLNIMMIIAEIAFSLECHILLDMINICEEKNLFEIVQDFHGKIEGFLIKPIKQSHRNKYRQQRLHNKGYIIFLRLPLYMMLPI